MVIKKVLIITACLSLLCSNTFAQVRVVRSMPEDAPQVSLQKVPKEVERPVKISGRLNLGYQMTKDTLGSRDTTLSSLSSLAFRTLFGLTGDVELGRQNLTNGNIQDVKLGMRMQKQNYSISFNTTNSNKDTIVEDKLHTNKSNGISLSVGLKVMENLPINLGYSSNKNHSKGAGTLTQKTASNNLSFGLQGKVLTRINWNLSLNQGDTKDILNDKKTKNSGISLGFDLPITNKISMATNISSNRTKNYLSQDNSTKITQQGCNTNFNFKVSEKLNTSLGMLYNTGKSSINGGTKTTSSSTGNNFNLSYRLKENMNLSYNLNQIKSANMHTQDNNINITYLPKEAKISNINLSYGLSRSKSDITRTNRHNVNITSSPKLTKQLNLTQGIGISKEADKKTWQVNTGLRYSIQMLATAVDLSQNKTEDKGKTTAKSQNIQTSLSYPAKVLNRQIPVSLSYGYNLSGIENEVKSTSFGFSFSMPVNERINFGYSHSQSSSQQTNSQNNTFNISLQGKKRPYSINTTINLLKQDKLTQNLSTNLSYSLLKELSLTTGMHYTKKEDRKPAYNFNLGIVYSF